MADASSKASLILEVVDLDAYRTDVDAARKATEALTEAQKAAGPIQRTTRKVNDEAAVAAKALAKAQSEVEKAYISALAPHEKTRLKLEQTLALQFDNVEMTTKQAVAVAHLSLKLEDQTRRFEMNRGAQHKLSRSLAELLDEQTKAQTAAIAAGAAMLKEGLSSQKLSVAIEHLRDTTGEADRKTEAYREEVARLEGQLRDVTAAEKAQAAAQVAAAEHYDLTKKKLDAVETAMEGLRLPGAEIVTSFKRMSDAMETANRTLTPMQVNLLKGAIAVGAMAAASAAAVAGIVALGAAVVANSAAADDWNHELRAVGLSLDAAGTAAVNRAAAGIDAVSVAGKLLGVTVAETMAPAVEQAGTRLVALGLMAVDAWKKFAAGKEPLVLIAEIVGKGLTLAFDTLVSPIKNVALGLALLLDTAGVTEDAAARLNAGFREFSDTMSERAAAAIEEYANQKLPELIAATDDYMGKASKLVTRTAEINRVNREGVLVLKSLTEALDIYGLKAVDVYGNVDKIARKTYEGVAAYSEAATDNQKADIDEIKAAAATAVEQEKASAEQFAAFMFQQRQAVLGQVGALAGSVMSLTNLAEDGMTRMWKAMFVVQKAAALSSIAINTAANISAAALAFTFPSPPGIAAVTAVATLGALQAATVAASAFGEYRQAQATAAGGAGGGASASGGAPATSGGGSIPTLPGGGGAMTQGAASGPASYGGGGEGPRPLSIPSSDGYFPPSMGGRTIQTAPGDEAWVQRSGALNRANQSGDSMAGLERRLDALLTEFKGLRQDSRMRLHFAAATGPARGQ